MSVDYWTAPVLSPSASARSIARAKAAARTAVPSLKRKPFRRVKVYVLPFCEIFGKLRRDLGHEGSPTGGGLSGYVIEPGARRVEQRRGTRIGERRIHVVEPVEREAHDTAFPCLRLERCGTGSSRLSAIAAIATAEMSRTRPHRRLLGRTCTEAYDVPAPRIRWAGASSASLDARDARGLRAVEARRVRKSMRHTARAYSSMSPPRRSPATAATTRSSFSMPS